MPPIGEPLLNEVDCIRAAIPHPSNMRNLNLDRLYSVIAPVALTPVKHLKHHLLKTIFVITDVPWMYVNAGCDTMKETVLPSVSIA
ncbi:hypothetical protein TNCV_3933931 [Trichonephila clavipes]|nr:hypothetical protein TNCV_3933931 [Trichonephila clavipes]